MNEKGQEKNSTMDPLKLYMKELRRTQLLTPQEEKELGHRIQRGDQVALNQLVERNLRFVIRVAKKYRNYGVPFQDLINEGNIGLMEAAKRFDPSRNVRFISYAVWWIRQSILLAIANHGHTFRLPPKINTELFKAIRSRQENPDLLKSDSDFSKQSPLIRSLIQAGKTVSIDESLHPAIEQSLKETLTQQNEDSIEEKIITRRSHHALRDAVNSLSSREAEVIRQRFGLEGDEPRSLKEIGMSMGLSRERIRQIQVRAIERLRATENAAFYC